MTTATSPSRRIVLGAGVRLTRLPFGGAVLMNEKTLALVECAERDAALIGCLLSGECPGLAPDPGPDSDDADLRRVARDLLRSQWLVVTDEAK
ncbi:actinodefensin-associated protein B [Streptomyces sp. H27-C3]|uniref:actinodefensin-associated protein B n=1 Tax=Streptomyces sp. H27-C3 TaxID=3046305 RepID=UPI0024B8F057|nr:actinodefensin-associated protein B [Streptomyces sp. H27-C3]MDJ0460325.1 actinodefensin-associated protein B [Streptomyces sp. H27-C3]